MEERRRYPRLKKSIAIIVHRPYSEGKIEVLNISLVGVSIYGSLKYYNLEDTVFIELILSKGDSIVCNARVVWLYPNAKEAPEHKAGLEFLDMSEGDKEKLRIFLEYPSD